MGRSGREGKISHLLDYQPGPISKVPRCMCVWPLWCVYMCVSKPEKTKVASTSFPASPTISSLPKCNNAHSSYNPARDPCDHPSPSSIIQIGENDPVHHLPDPLKPLLPRSAPPSRIQYSRLQSSKLLLAQTRILLLPSSRLPRRPPRPLLHLGLRCRSHGTITANWPKRGSDPSQYPPPPLLPTRNTHLHPRPLQNVNHRCSPDSDRNKRESKYTTILQVLLRVPRLLRLKTKNLYGNTMNLTFPNIRPFTQLPHSPTPTLKHISSLPPRFKLNNTPPTSAMP